MAKKLNMRSLKVVNHKKSLRVISGKYKGRRLYFPPLDVLKPTKDIVKESLFNIIGISLSGKSFIDLFAGSGSVGIEAISRGAGRVFFVEQSIDCVRILRKNLDILSVEENNVVCSDVFVFLSRDLDSIVSFDYVFCDPSYDFPNYDNLIDSIYPILAINGVLIIEHSRRRNIVSRNLHFIDRYNYGISSLSIFKRG